MIKVSNHLSEHGKIIREEVFIKEQGFTIEIDEIDNFANHVVYYLNNIPVAACRFFKDEVPNSFHLGRFAVKKEYRNKHIGKEMLNLVVEEIKKLGGIKIVLSSQLDAVGFYQKCGFEIISDIYYEQHCPHKDMIKKII